ncbi:hypothetical protein [Calderihabitans maritimus]|uniref:Uncharacterized protein n=1 Tax=Calderihabitans maritimus TaxID=1246530 RepID=A0A1Z5HRU2_9FIRM|nr:hypothetical protein [Calderihabitans maritimus]GAW92234.1 hypothetical protein KKC1_13920 [Calderihabitans maritimus]
MSGSMLKQLIEEMKKEGSWDDYVRYLKERYGYNQFGTHFNFHVDDYPCRAIEMNDTFIEQAMEQDLNKKSLEKIWWIADAEREFTDKPFFTAIDRYYRMNADAFDNRQALKFAVKEFEEAHRGRSSLQYSPNHESREDNTALLEHPKREKH